MLNKKFVAAPLGTHTPLGLPVEPEVYMTYAGVWGSTLAGNANSLCEASVAESSSMKSTGALPNKSRSLDVVMIEASFECWTM
jgi:hypothetical protein